MATVAATERGQKAITNVERLCTQLRAESDEFQSLREVVTELERRIDDGSNDPEANVITTATEGGDQTDDGAVTIMTIHEAKGTESPVVVVPEAGRSFRGASKAELGDQSAEFEMVPTPRPDTDTRERQPILGLKSPELPAQSGDDDPGSRVIAQHQRNAEERAEAKRSLYVACTRARDHLILSGQHNTSSDDEYPVDLKPPSPAAAGEWRDWIQAILIGPHPDDGPSENPPDPEHVISELAKQGQFERTIPYTTDEGKQTGTVTLALPPEPRRYEQDEQSSVDLDDYRPPREPGEYLETVVQITPAQCTGLKTGDGRLAETDPAVVSYQRNPGNTASSGSGSSVPGDLPATQFGTLVHRFCELRPNSSERLDLAIQLLNEEEIDLHSGDFDLETAVSAAEQRAERAHEDVDTIRSDLSDPHAFREYPLAVEFQNPPLAGVETVELNGEIDLLLVTEDTYHIVDYKTNRPSDDDDMEFFRRKKREQYDPQIMAYAAGLAQADPSRRIDATLVFTEVNVVAEWENIDQSKVSMFKILETGLSEIDDGPDSL